MTRRTHVLMRGLPRFHQTSKSFRCMQQMTERQRERPRVGASAGMGDETSGMSQTGQMVVPSEMKVLMNHIYEYKKGVRRMILFTCNRRFEQQACHRLCRQSIDYVVQPAGKENVNVYFGRRECLDAIRLFVPVRSMSCRPKRTSSSEPCLATTSVHSVKGTVNVKVGLAI